MSVVCVFFTCVFERCVCVCVWLFESTHLVPMLLAQVHNTTVVVCRRYTGKICPVSVCCLFVDLLVFFCVFLFSLCVFIFLECRKELLFVACDGYYCMTEW